MTKTKTLPHYTCDKETGEPTGIEAVFSIGGVSLQIKKISIPFACALEPEHARCVLAEGQLNVTISPIQGELFEAKAPEFSGVADCHRLSIGHGEDQKGTFSFQADAVDIPSLLSLKCSDVRVTAMRVGPSGGTKSETPGGGE